jgi:tetratricopeptide (TPR) repeat protein
MYRKTTLFVLVCLLTTAVFGQQRPQTQRDLKVEKDIAPEVSTPTGNVRIPRSYALVIGIAKYKNLSEKQQLHYSERDAESIYSILISPEGGNFRAENVRTLIGSKATLAGIRKEMEEWLPSVAKEQDRVLVYFAGHGFVAQGQAYLAPYDIELDRIAQTAYSMTTLGSVFGKIKAKWKVLLTDSCHSGAVTPDADVQTINKSLIDVSRSLFSLTASRDRERSFESPDWGGGHGIFTYYVVRGLEGEGDENRDGIVTADELAEYVRSNVRQATEGKQNPTSDRSSFDPDMLLAYVPTRAAVGEAPPPKFGALIVESNMDGVEVFLDDKSVGIVNKLQPLRLPGLVPGNHTIRGIKMGYEPDGPRDEMVYPGQEKTVSIKILILRRRNKAAVEAFDKGIEAYTRGFEGNYRKAVENFEKALQLDPTYSQAALYLGRAYNALFEEQKAEQAFRKAIEIDPDYLEARSSFAGMLLDIGGTDEAIRQLTVVVQRDPQNGMAQYLLSQAFRTKDQFTQSIEAASKAIKLNPSNPEPHFWLAESLRLSGAYDKAVTEYAEYLKLSDFNSKLAGKMNYYVLGFLAGFGKKKRAAQQDIWKDLRSLAYFGMCDSHRKLSDYDAAIASCQRALNYDPEDPYVHYALGLIYARKAQATGRIESLPAARQHFATMLKINSEMAEAEYARKNIASIDAALKSN